MPLFPSCTVLKNPKIDVTNLIWLTFHIRSTRNDYFLHCWPPTRSPTMDCFHCKWPSCCMGSNGTTTRTCDEA